MASEVKTQENGFFKAAHSKTKKPAIDPDCILTPEERKLVAEARRDLKEGKLITLDALRKKIGV